MLKKYIQNVLSIKNADKEQSNVFKKLIWVNGKNQSIFYKNTRFLLDVREKVLNTFKSKVFPIEDSTPDPTTDTPVFYTPKKTKARCRKPLKRNISN